MVKLDARTHLFVTFDFPPDAGGIQRVTQRLAEAATQAGLDIFVLAPATRGDREFDRMQPYRVIRYAKRRGILKYASIAWAALRAVWSIRPRTIVAMTWNPPALAIAPLRFLVRTPLTVLAHGTEIATQNSRARLAALRFALRGTDVAANSAFTAALLRERGITDVRIVNPGADAETDAAAERERAPLILCAGRLIARKGYDRVIAAMPEVLERIPHCRLIVAGDGPDRGRLEALARDSNAAGQIAFAGRVDDAELSRLYARAWCFAMPNRRDGDDVEGFGIVFLEAALHGLAAIGGSGSGAEDAIVDGVTGYLVDGESTGAVAAALLRVLSDRDAAFAMGAAARTRAQTDFTWERYAAQLLRVPDAAVQSLTPTATSGAAS